MPLIRTVEGGKLLTDGDPRTVGPENCTRRINIRRDDDAETLMPGWVAYGSLPEGEECQFIHRAVRPNGDRAILAFSDTAIYKRNEATGAWDLLKDGFTAGTKEWQAESIDGYVIVNNGIDLPHVWDWDQFTPLYELREQGIIRCGSMWTGYDFIFFADITEFSSAALSEWMNWNNPYGFVPYGLSGTTRTPYRVIWTDKPTDWGLSLNVRVLGGETPDIIELPFPCLSLKAGDTVNFTSTETPPSFFTDQVISTVEGANLRMERIHTGETISGILTRSTFSSRILGYSDLQGEGSTILKGGMLGRYIYVMRENEIILGEITESATEPFIFQPVYRGIASPTSRQLIQLLGEDSVFYYSRGGWYQFNVQSQRPQRLSLFDDNNSLFSRSVDEAESFSVDLVTEQELWIFLKDRTMVFDYGDGLLTEIDAVFDAAALVDDPADNDPNNSGVDRLLILARGGNLYRFVSNVFTRDDAAYTGLLEYGWAGDTGNLRDTVYRRYFPAGRGDAVLVSINRATSGSDTTAPVITDQVQKLGIGIQLYLRAQWIQDSITITSGTTRLIGREIEQYSTDNRARGFRGNGTT